MGGAIRISRQRTKTGLNVWFLSKNIPVISMAIRVMLRPLSPTNSSALRACPSFTARRQVGTVTLVATFL